MKIKFQILNDFQAPANIKRATNFIALFPHESGENLEKTNINILDVDNAIGEIMLSDFEVQGLQSGKDLSFIVGYKIDDKSFKALFPDAYSIKIDDEGRKSIDEN